MSVMYGETNCPSGKNAAGTRRSEEREFHGARKDRAQRAIV
jgi:hypothetical protein